MAGPTIGAKGAKVSIFCPMAGITIGRRALENIIDMATITDNR
jgi:hypothetical protein